jgi:hypothetical protein
LENENKPNRRGQANSVMTR